MNELIIKLEISVEELNIILEGLLELQGKKSINLIGKLKNEGQKQFDEFNKK